MTPSLLYHAFGVKEYAYSGTAYKDSAIFFKLHHVEPKICTCPCCGSHSVIKYGTIERELRSLPIGSKLTFLQVRGQRYQCKDCKKVWLSPIPFTHGNVSYTFRLSRYVIDLLREGMTIEDVANHLGMSWATIKDIHKKYLHNHYAYPNISQVKHIGIDEFSTKKGHVYKTIVVDLDSGHIIYVGDGKGKEALDKFWKKVRRQGAVIEVVTSDLSAAYIASVMENAPDAVHVYDHFHVVKLVNDAVDNVRRKLWHQETDVGKRKIIKGARWMLLYRGKDIMDRKFKTRLDNILATNKDLMTAYYLKEDLELIWQRPNKEEAGRQLEYWCQNAIESKLPDMIKVANSIKAYRSGILAWYDCHISNAMVEGTNTKIKLMKRKAYGYRDDEYFKLRLLGLHDKTNANLR